MIDHEIVLNWKSDSDDVTVEHKNQVDEPQVGDTITFKANPPAAAVLIKFESGSNFSVDDEKYVIADSEPHIVKRPGNFKFSCAVIERLRDKGSGSQTKPPGPKSQATQA
jgi:hypothetical protein